MNVAELKQKLDQGEPMLLLDVREAEEVEAGAPAIPGAEHMPMGKVFTEAAKGNLPKTEKIVTICKTGGRCEIIARELGQQGYDIEALEGGLEEWKKIA